jgi:hypothetical protein
MSFGPYTAVMKECGWVVEHTPQIELGNRMGITHYIDFLREEDMGDHSVVRYVDRFQRDGFALRLKNLKSGHVSILAPFQRYTDNRGWWSHGWSGHDALEDDLFYYEKDQGRWSTAGGKINHDMLRDILQGRHPIAVLYQKDPHRGTIDHQSSGGNPLGVS